MRSYLVCVAGVQYVALAVSSCSAAAAALQLYPDARSLRVRPLKSHSTEARRDR